jgi:hypothetical protein
MSCGYGKLLVDKRISISGSRLRVTYHFNGVTEGLFRTELNLAMPSCDGPAGRFVHNNLIPGGFGQTMGLEAVKKLELQDEVMGGSLAVHLNVPAQIHSQPHFTVSQSEAGFEKIMQAVTLTLAWPLSAQVREVTVDLEVGVSGA